MNLIILGPQGSGKGTQARLLADSLGLFYFESGDFLREVAKKDPRVDEIINKNGQLLGDDEVFTLASKFLDEKLPDRENFILDGYPRSVPQYNFLKEWLGEKGKKLNWAIYLTLTEKESMRRITARRICEKCGRVYNLITNPPLTQSSCECGGRLVQRPDDTPDVVKKRLESYKKITSPLVEVLAKEGILLTINGEAPIDTILKETISKIT